MCHSKLGSAGPDLVVEQQLTARRRPYVGDLLERALVGDREPADLVDLVAPELDAERVLLGRREHVDDAAAHRELAAALNQVDARVCRRGQLPHDLVEGDLVTLVQLDRGEVGKPLDLRLEQRTYRRDDDPERAGGGVLVVVGSRVHQAAQHREAPADGVRARRQTLVRERLPGREVGDGVGAEQLAELRHEVLALSRCRGDREHRRLLRQGMREERPQRFGRLDVERAEPVGAILERLLDRGFGGDEGRESVREA